jgi:predicted methyltransferase
MAFGAPCTRANVVRDGERQLVETLTFFVKDTGTVVEILPGAAGTISKSLRLI